MTKAARVDAEARGHGEGSSGDMDPRLWGTLRKYIDLKIIYNKLPMEEFFRLRQVCKDWNRLASDEGFLEESFTDPIPKPYFVVDSGKMGHRLFTRDTFTRRWTWTRLPPAKCAVSGLLVDYSEHGTNNFVFNLNTRVFHALPPAPALPDEDEEFEEPIVGLTVDTSVSPYSFKVYLGHEEIATRIYDSKSNSWTQKDSLNEYSGIALESENVQKPYCLYCNGILYFRVWVVYKPMIDCQSYNLEKDKWENGKPSVEDEVWAFCDMGVWQDRVFLVRMNPEADAAIEVLESTGDDPDSFNLVKVGRMPETLKTWMLAGQEDKVEHFSEEVEIQGVFCGEHLLVYNCSGVDEVTERAVLYNLEGKTWEKLELPPSWPRVVKKDEGGEEDEDGEEEYEDGEEGIEDDEEGLEEDEEEEVEEEEGEEEVEEEVEEEEEEVEEGDEGEVEEGEEGEVEEE